MQARCINQQTIKLFCDEIQKALQPLAGEYGVRIKLEVADGKKAAAEDFQRYAGLFGLNEDDLGRTFEYGRPTTSTMVATPG